MRHFYAKVSTKEDDTLHRSPVEQLTDSGDPDGYEVSREEAEKIYSAAERRIYGKKTPLKEMRKNRLLDDLAAHLEDVVPKRG